MLLTALTLTHFNSMHFLITWLTFFLLLFFFSGSARNRTEHIVIKCMADMWAAAVTHKAAHGDASYLQWPEAFSLQPVEEDGWFQDQRSAHHKQVGDVLQTGPPTRNHIETNSDLSLKPEHTMGWTSWWRSGDEGLVINNTPESQDTYSWSLGLR